MSPPGVSVVIVVDNDSSDGSVEAIRREFPAVTVVAQNENRGFAGGVAWGPFPRGASGLTRPSRRRRVPSEGSSHPRLIPSGWTPRRRSV